MENECATFKGLHKWHAAMFEKVGWMILAKNKCHSKEEAKLKLQVYHNSIDKLTEALKKKLEKTKDEDRKGDLEILLKDVCILKEFVEKNLSPSKSQEGGGKRGSKKGALSGSKKASKK